MNKKEHKFVASVVQMLDCDCSAAIVDRLSCEVALEKALKVCSPSELRVCEEIGGEQWLRDRQSEYGKRLKAIQKFLKERKITKSTAKAINEWTGKNPYVRPVSGELIQAMDRRLLEASESVKSALAWQARLHNEDRFGWDYAAEQIDNEYEQMLQCLHKAQSEKQKAQKYLSLAKSGFCRSYFDV